LPLPLMASAVLELGGRGAGLRVVRLVDDDREVLPLEGLVRDDGFHRIREGLDGDDDDGRAGHQGVGQLLTLRLRGLLAVDGGDHAKLMVDLFDGILKLAVQHIAVGDDDDAAEDRLAVVTAQLHEVMGRPGNRAGLAGTGAVVGQIDHAGAVLLGIGDHFVDC
jgi:hypothetical protein